MANSENRERAVARLSPKQKAVFLFLERLLALEEAAPTDLPPQHILRVRENGAGAV